MVRIVGVEDLKLHPVHAGGGEAVDLAHQASRWPGHPPRAQLGAAVTAIKIIGSPGRE